MTEKLIESWEKAARDAAIRVRDAAVRMVPDEISLSKISLEEANGTNSLDKAYMERLCKREHLTENFLANAM